MGYNPHLNPMTAAEFEADSNVTALRSQWAGEGPLPPFSSGRLRIAITEKCNYGCPFCYNEGTSGVSRQLTTRQIDLVLEAVLPAVRTIKLSGGEPLVHPDFASIVRMCASRRPTTVTTNGALLTRHMKCLAHLARITVSVVSTRPDRYATMMGTRVTPHEIFCSVEKCRLALQVPFEFNCVVTKANVDEVLDLCTFAHDCGGSKINLLGLLELAPDDRNTYVALQEITDMMTPRFGPPAIVSSTRLRYQTSSEFTIDVVYQYCMVGCDVCRNDGFIRVDSTPGFSYCLASEPLSIREALEREDVAELRALFISAISSMGTPRGRQDLILLPRHRKA